MREPWILFLRKKKPLLLTFFLFRLRIHSHDLQPTRKRREQGRRRELWKIREEGAMEDDKIYFTPLGKFMDERDGEARGREGHVGGGETAGGAGSSGDEDSEGDGDGNGAHMNWYGLGVLVRLEAVMKAAGDLGVLVRCSMKCLRGIVGDGCRCSGSVVLPLS